MRQLPKRSALSPALVKRLKSQSEAIIKIAVESECKAEAKRRYENARKAKWFKPVIEALRAMAGKTERCMLCSGSESSDLEHYHPKAMFPELALTWENFLWSCGVCNGAKLNLFPTEADKKLINPIEENVWDFFRIDEYGSLTARFNTALNQFDPRAISTMKIVRLDRQALQENRQRHLRRLKRSVEHSLELFRLRQLSKKELAEIVEEWRDDAGQPDVADYFLNGPGRTEKPFAELFKLLA